MPKAKRQFDGLLDSWGRRNRTLSDKNCETCGKAFRPKQKTSRFCSRRCAWAQNGGHNKKLVSWWRTPRGYIEGRIWLDDDTQLRIKQHRFVAEGILGRPLLPTEDVHHIDGDKANNNPSNLEIIDHAEHTRRSNASRVYARGYKMNLSVEEREARSLRAIASGLAAKGQAAIAKAKGDAE